jgi:hypothetical protein
MVRVEKAADQHVRLTRAAMVRTPVQAPQFLVWKHRRDVGIFPPHCERRMRR